MKKYILLITFAILASSCEEFLEEKVFIEVASNNFFQSDEDAEKAVYALYAKIRADGSVTDNSGQRESWGFYGMGEGSIFNLNEIPTDEIYVHWESYGGFWQYLEELSWLPNSGSHFDQLFADLYEGIGIANNILVNIENEGISEAVQDRVKGEAYMARGLFYSTALSFYRNIPLVLEVVNDPHFKPFQADPDSVIASVVSDLEMAASLLPRTVTPDQYGRFTSGSALAQLARFQLNQGNWTAARDAALAVKTLDVYSLSPSYADIFAVENSTNPEIIFCIPCIAQPGIGNTFIAHTAEPDFVTGGWGGHLLRNDFYNSFDPADLRRTHLLNTYTDINGGMGSVSQGHMIMKYEVDPGRVGPWAGNDLVLHRYAEVLLTHAEALNEINGPTQESIDLINELRRRAFADDPAKLLQLSDFNASKEALRDQILAERGWELYAEGYRRDDLIRQGRFVEQAVARGKTADDHQIIFPIPQVEIDRNTNLDQNDDYNQ